MLKRFFPCLVLSLVILVSCNDGNDLLDKTNNFDQSPLLVNLGENLIIPAYAQLADDASELKLKVEAFVESPDLSGLEEVRAALVDARITWQSCMPYQFGPALDRGLSSALNIYPLDERRVEDNISEGGYDLSSLSNADARGFLAVSYLLNTPGLSDEEILNNLNDSRKQYLKDVTADISAVSSNVYNDWAAEGGNYVSEFSSDDARGIDVGSSVAKLVNAMNLTFERAVRDGKVGIPLGVRSLGEPIPDAVEAPYTNQSVDLLIASLKAYHNLYLGNSSGSDPGTGFDDYLQGVEAATSDNQDLAKTIADQFETVISAAENLKGMPLSERVVTDQVPAETVFAEMQRLIVYFKTDMASSLGVLITYQDNDGD